MIVTCNRRNLFNRSVWVRTAITAAIIAICPAILPVASANCHGGDPSRGQINPPSPRASVPSDLEASQVPDNSQASAHTTIAGLWKITFLSDGAVVDIGFDAWHSDGTEILNDYTDPINGNVCLGVWEQTGQHTYKLKHPSWYFDGNGKLLGTVIIHETVCLSPSGNRFAGDYTYDIYDVAGNLVEETSGTVKAARITAD